MVKIERLEEWAASDKCLSVLETRHFIHLYEIVFNKLNTIIFYCKMAQFLINKNIYFLFYKIF